VTGLAATIRIEVCAAWPDQVVRQGLSIPAETTIAQLRVLLSHPGHRLTPELDSPEELPEGLREAWSACSALSVFGEIVGEATVLKNGDRLELLRPLIADPKEARRNKAKRTAKVRARQRIAKDTAKRASIRARRAAKEGV